MKITLYTIGKIKASFLREGIDEYIKRLKPYAQLSIVELGESKASEKPSAQERDQIVLAEGERLLKQIKDKSFLIVLDVYGKMYSSEALAELIYDCGLKGKSDIAFVIGGAFGISPQLRDKADVCLSFSPMTFTHQMIRLLLVEQIYRSFKINRHEPYHW